MDYERMSYLKVLTKLFCTCIVAHTLLALLQVEALPE
jgi:hypothetical protein